MGRVSALRLPTMIVLLLAMAFPLLAQTETARIPVFAQYQRVNVRSGPGAVFSIIGQLELGQALWASGRSDTANNWLRIDLDGREGWVAWFTLLVRGDADHLPVVEAANPQRRDHEHESVRAHVFRTVNVRVGPTIESAKIAALHDGDDVAIVGRDSVANDWLLIEFEGRLGWVAWFTVTVIGDVNRLDVVEVATGSTDSNLIMSATSSVTAHAFRTVNVRQGPGIAYDRIGQLTSGDTVAVTGRSDAGNNWLRIDFDGQTGWIAWFTVTVSGDPATLSMVEPVN